MRKRIFGRRLKRTTGERKALFRSLMHSLVLYGKLRTTEAKAKAIKADIEKLVTRAKNDGEEARRILLSRLASEKATDRIIAEIAPKFKDRPGGYTRILKLAPRIKDGADQVLVTWVEEVKAVSLGEPKRNVGKVKSAKAAKEEPKKEEKKETKKKGSK